MDVHVNKDLRIDLGIEKKKRDLEKVLKSTFLLSDNVLLSLGLNMRLVSPFVFRTKLY